MLKTIIDYFKAKPEAPDDELERTFAAKMESYRERVKAGCAKTGKSDFNLLDTDELEVQELTLQMAAVEFRDNWEKLSIERREKKEGDGFIRSGRDAAQFNRDSS